MRQRLATPSSPDKKYTGAGNTGDNSGSTTSSVASSVPVSIAASVTASVAGGGAVHPPVNNEKQGKYGQQTSEFHEVLQKRCT